MCQELKTESTSRDSQCTCTCKVKGTCGDQGLARSKDQVQVSNRCHRQIPPRSFLDFLFASPQSTLLFRSEARLMRTCWLDSHNVIHPEVPLSVFHSETSQSPLYPSHFTTWTPETSGFALSALLWSTEEEIQEDQHTGSREAEETGSREEEGII